MSSAPKPCHWSSWQTQDDSAYYFSNHGAFSEVKKAMDPLLKQMHTEISPASHFKGFMAQLRLTIHNPGEETLPHLE